MTDKVYLQNSYITHFSSPIKTKSQQKNGWHVTLNSTCFYPESGGQPADRGNMGSANVIDVKLDGEDIVHLLNQDPGEGTVECSIDWARRYDHMTQHTGQHLLTSAFIELFDASTLSFHLGESASTIDLDIGSVSQNQIRQIEDLCSQWISAALPVSILNVSRNEFDSLPLRKKALPEHIAEPVRLIKIGDIDVAHCGGTHIKNTAELQLIKIIGQETVRDSIRINFLAGQRAILDYQKKQTVLNSLSNIMTTGEDELEYVVSKLHTDFREVSSQLNKTKKELLGYKATEDLAQAETSGKHKIICKKYENLDGKELKNIAGTLTEKEKELLFCGVSINGDKVNVVLAGGEDVRVDLGSVMQTLLQKINGRGGGRGNYAQGVGESRDIDNFLEIAKRKLKEL